MAGQRPRLMRGLCCVRCRRSLERLFAGKRDTFAAIEDLTHGIEDEPESSCRGNGHNEVMVLVHDVAKRVHEGWAKPDGEKRADQELRELSAEDGQNERNQLHLEDAGGELEEFERGGGRKHRRNHDGEELLALEAVANLLVALAVDALEQEELAASATDEEGNQRAEGGRGCGHEAVGEESMVIGRDIADDDAVHGDGDGDERGVDERQAADTPDPEGL